MLQNFCEIVSHFCICSYLIHKGEKSRKVSNNCDSLFFEREEEQVYRDEKIVECIGAEDDIHAQFYIFLYVVLIVMYVRFFKT